ncbi:MAG TPA: DUF512 domain-containing protein, partial [Halanaerobiales bacterium]|nr:DUF512 domain-containing protein [Halanaerobiales bacterium]
KTDLKKGDIIESINGQRIVSRIAAFIMAEKLKDPVLEVIRDNQRIRIKISKEQGGKPGFIIHSDISPEKIKTIKSSLLKKKGSKTLMLCSLPGAKLMKSLLDIITVPSRDVRILAVSNEFFGGSIACAGLLTIKDIIKTLEDDNGIYETIILPRIMFDIFGNDLTGASYNIIEEKTGIPVEIL